MSERNAPVRRHRALLAIGVALAVVFGALQYWSTSRITDRAEEIAREVGQLAGDQLGDVKTREELIAKRIENRLRGFFWQSFLANLGPLVTALVALAGLLTGLNSYLATREKESEDRASAHAKERADRAAAEFKDTLARVAGKEARERMVGIVGLQHFFIPGREEQHLPALAALTAALRIEDNDEVRRAARVVAEAAAAALQPEVLVKVSWQRLRLRGINLAGRHLAGIDLRDADLEDAVLTGADLRGARLDAAILKGARCDDAKLRGAVLSYVDLAGASLRGADLEDAQLDGAKLWKVDVARATFGGTSPGLDALRWDLVQGWRDAHLSPALKAALEERYGPAPRGPRVLMLMWEVPPFISGGAWTASHHLVRALRRAGADLTVVVPWAIEAIEDLPFGLEVPVVGMGLSAPPMAGPYAGATGAGSSYDRASTPPYGGGYSPASATEDGGGRAWSGYGASSGTPLLRLTQAFAERVRRWAADQDFAVVHAHDWVTWAAARSAATALRSPWIAHVHSLEGDRRPTARDPIILRLEAEGLDAASRVLVPGRETRARAMRDYGVAENRIAVVPNALSRSHVVPARMGAFETRRVMFLGRLTAQKGPDLFADVAARVKARMPDARFELIGAGDETAALRRSSAVTVRPPIEWERREAAFAQASAILVTSRSEPFGMVVLEAMQAGVPVLYPRTSGAADALKSGIRIDPEATAAVADALTELLTRPELWEDVVRAQLAEIAAYAERNHALPIEAAWASVAAGPDRSVRGATATRTENP